MSVAGPAYIQDLIDRHVTYRTYSFKSQDHGGAIKEQPFICPGLRTRHTRATRMCITTCALPSRTAISQYSPTENKSQAGSKRGILVGGKLRLVLMAFIL